MMDHEQVRKLRMDLGVSQAELARATGINRTVLSGFETGQLALKGDCERRLADYFSHRGIDLVALRAESNLGTRVATAPKRASAATPFESEGDRRSRSELNSVERRIRELEHARCEKGLIDSFMERDKAERAELHALLARWRTLVLTLENQAVPALSGSKKPVTHADALAREYRELCKTASGNG